MWSIRLYGKWRLQTLSHLNIGYGLASVLLEMGGITQDRTTRGVAQEMRLTWRHCPALHRSYLFARNSWLMVSRVILRPQPSYARGSLCTQCRLLLENPSIQAKCQATRLHAWCKTKTPQISHELTGRPDSNNAKIMSFQAQMDCGSGTNP